MKSRIFVLSIFAWVCLSLLTVPIYAQSKNKTIVLVRHAEKDVSVGASKTDPDLSPEGRERARRLADLLRRYKPHEIFSTNYKRTRQTAEPIAARRKKEIQTYDPAESEEFIKKILASKTDHNLIVGHSNTIPALANLIAGKQVFRDLPDSEYGVVWVIRLRRGVFQKIEIFTF
jgi:2,3-bisphosphoglycerate-dependent phosphoglycerate mutase